VRVYKYDATKTTAQWDDQSLANFGPVGWNRLGQDIDGNLLNGRVLSVSSDGTTYAVGDDIIYTGNVRVFRYNANSNSLYQYGNTISSIQHNSGTGSGISLSADGNIIAIAAENAGIFTIYSYNSSTNYWDQIGNNIYYGVSTSQISLSISADGTTLAIGSGVYNNTYSGQVRVYKYNGTWNQKGNIIYGISTAGYLGSSISISSDGNTLAVSGNGLSTANVYKYNSNTNAWDNMGGTIWGGSTIDSVSLSSDGTIIAVGGIANGFTAYHAGAVYIYKYENSVWNLYGNIIYGRSSNEYFGWSVSLSSDGTIVVVGGRGYNNARGVTRVYKLQ
jgi:WD40 repeat protein